VFVTIFAVPVLVAVLFGDDDVTLGTTKVIAETKVLVEYKTSFRDPGKTVIALSEPRDMGVWFNVFVSVGREGGGLGDG